MTRSKVRSSRSSVHCKAAGEDDRGRVDAFLYFNIIIIIFNSKLYKYSPPLSLLSHKIITSLLSFSTLFSIKYGSQPIPKPDSVDGDMPMFAGGGGGARWPGHEDYRVETPGSVGSTFVEESEFDLFFKIDACRVEDG